MAMASSNLSLGTHQNTQLLRICCRKKERERERNSFDPYKVIEISPPPKNLGIRCFPPNLQCGESVTIEGQAYTISAVTHRYQLRKGSTPVGIGRYAHIKVISLGSCLLVVISMVCFVFCSKLS